MPHHKLDEFTLAVYGEYDDGTGMKYADSGGDDDLDDGGADGLDREWVEIMSGRVR